MTWLTAAGTAGGAFAPAEAANYFFDRLAAMSVGLASGFRQERTIRATLEIPRLLDDGAANWVTEGDEITPTDPDADVVVATPRKIAALSYASNELIADSNPAAQRTLAENLARSVALRLDLGFFEGTGVAPQIRGLKNQSGIQVVSLGANGAAFTDLDPFADAIGLLGQVDAAASAIVMHPRTWRALMKLKEADTGSTKPLLQAHAGSGSDAVRPMIYGVPVWTTSQLSTTETKGTATTASSVYVYQADQVVAVSREAAATIEVDRSAAFSRDSTAVRVTMRADLVLPNPEAVVRIEGVIP